jgi:hypothetical protein
MIYPEFLRVQAFGLAIIIIAAVTNFAGAQPSEPPRLELNSPFSGSPHSLDSDVSGNFLVTAGSSRMLTLWSRYSETQWEPRVIHAPQRDEFASGAYIGAISPDGTFLAFAVPPLSDGQGGYRKGSARIYMIERLSQQIVTIFSVGIPTRITKLRFSEEGNYLAAMLGQGCGVRLWTRKQWTTPDRNQPPEWSDDEGYAGIGTPSCCPGPDSITCEHMPSGMDVAFFPSSQSDAPWMVTLSENGLRTYVKTEQTFRRAGYTPLEAMSLVRPGKMAISPDGEKIAVGDVWAPRLTILNREGTDYRPLTSLTIPEAVLNTEGKHQAASSVGGMYLPNPVWAESGGHRVLYAFGYLPSSLFVDGQSDSNANRFAVFDLERDEVKFGYLGDDIDASLYTTQSHQNPAKRIFFVSTHGLSMLDADAAKPRAILTRSALDLRGNDFSDWRLMLSKERQHLYLTAAAGDRSFIALEFDFEAMRIMALRSYDNLDDLHADLAEHSQAYYDADARPKEWGFEQRIGNDPGPAFFGKSLSLERLYPNEVSYSGAKLPGKDMAAWGTSRAVRLIDSDGKIACSRPITSPAFRMNVTPDGRLLIVAGGDGSIRWYALADPSACLPLVASLYLTQNSDKSWGFLAWLPNGKFMTNGGAALKDIACYPQGTADSLGSCIKFQETDIFYSPADVRRALTHAESSEGISADSLLARVVAAKERDKQQQRTASIDFDMNTQTLTAEFPVRITMAGLTDATKYLTLTAGSGVDLPFTADGMAYSQARPFAIDGRRALSVVAHIPRTVQHRGRPIEICAAVLSKLLPNGFPDPSSMQLSKRPCRLVEWKGQEAPPTKRKLWALLIGFSQAPNDAAPSLQFAHQDAINFARLLQLDHDGALPGKSRFDDIQIRLVVATPGMNSDELSNDPKIQILQHGLGDQRFRVIYPQAPERYDELVRKQISTILESMKDPKRVNRADWEDVILIYFSGHGFSKYVSEAVPHIQVGLMTPDTNRRLDEGVIWVEKDLMLRLRYSNVVSLIIIDACSSEGTQDGVESLSAERTQLKLPIYEDASVHGGTELQFYLGSEVGNYSYEQTDYDVSDFVPNLALWPSKINTKGSGVFSLGLLTSLLCQEAGEEDSYTFETSSRFLRSQFFKQSNEKWQKGIRPKLENMMNKLGLSFVVPIPRYFGFPGGDGKSTALRSISPEIPRCGFSASAQ